jgi:hypothetical protein
MPATSNAVRAGLPLQAGRAIGRSRVCVIPIVAMASSEAARAYRADYFKVGRGGAFVCKGEAIVESGKSRPADSPAVRYRQPPDGRCQVAT